MFVYCEGTWVWAGAGGVTGLAMGGAIVGVGSGTGATKGVGMTVGIVARAGCSGD